MQQNIVYKPLLFTLLHPCCSHFPRLYFHIIDFTYRATPQLSQTFFIRWQCKNHASFLFRIFHSPPSVFRIFRTFSSHPTDAEISPALRKHLLSDLLVTSRTKSRRKSSTAMLKSILKPYWSSSSTSSTSELLGQRTQIIGSLLSPLDAESNN